MSGEIKMMNRRVFSTTLLAGAAASLISTRGMPANATLPKTRNVVLVHGLFADGSSWSEVIPRLQAAGLNVTSVQNPLTTLPEAVTSAERVLTRQDGPTVLVGHSFSGMIVTEAGVHPNVSALVYVAARAPDAGEDYTALAKKYPTPPASAGIVFDGDEGRLSEEAFLRDFAGDLPDAKAMALYAVQWPYHKALLAGKTTHAAWRSKPSYYAVSTEDRTINPDLERFMAKRMGAKTIEVKASHLSLISHPDEITRLILEAAGQRSVSTDHSSVVQVYRLPASLRPVRGFPALRLLRKLRPRSRPSPAVAASPVPCWAGGPSSRVPISNLRVVRR